MTVPGERYSGNRSWAECGHVDNCKRAAAGVLKLCMYGQCMMATGTLGHRMWHPASTHVGGWVRVSASVRAQCC